MLYEQLIESNTMIIIIMLSYTLSCLENNIETFYYSEHCVMISECCNITINELLHSGSCKNHHRTTTCPSKEFLFQSGIHHANSKISLSFYTFDKFVIRGEPNATIKCRDAAVFYLTFAFSYVPKVITSDIHSWNCKHYYSYLHRSNGTDIYSTETEILNSKFTNSRFRFKIKYRDAKITVKNTIIENCCESGFLDFLIMRELLRITLVNVNVINNTLPFFAPKKYQTYYYTSVFITFSGYINFTRNKGPIIRIPSHSAYYPLLIYSTQVLFSIAEVYIINNTIDSPFIMEDGEIVFEHCHVVFSGNHGGVSGGIEMYPKTKIVFNDNVVVEFSNNIGKRGGALSLGSSSTMIFNATKSNIVLSFKNNFAQRGGAIFVNESCSIQDVQSIFDLQCSAALVTLKFSDNSALFGGNQIYGGWVDWFKNEDGEIRYKPDITEEILTFEGSSDSEVASCPTRICLCKDGRPDCSITNTTMEIYGYALSLDLIAVGQRNTPLPAYVHANLTSGESDTKQNEELWYHLSPKTESLRATCTNISYKIYSNEEALLLEPSLYCSNKNFEPQGELKYSINDSVTAQAQVLFKQLSIHLKYKNCPLGFILHKTNRNCACHPLLSSLGLSCDLETTMIRRNKQQWVGVAHEHTTTSYEQPGVIVHKYCPFDYCRIDTASLLIRLEDQAELCAFNRSGILCGGCATNFSRVLGSSKCKVCTNNFKLFAIILGWLLSGLMLVILLMLLDLTVSVGTINGLTFYANIIQAQHATFCTPDIFSLFLYKFIAWLNLDQGIETCLYSGLDDYISTWLQFLFPLYIWLIAAALIVTSHYSTRVSKLIGNNAVQVLATLFLIVYTKLLRLIIEVFSFTTLTYPDGYKKTVWLIDGNVDFLKGKHVPLFLVTIIFVLFSLPYTFILLTIQFLYKISRYHVMFWVQRLKPFFDAYTGPYRDNHRYWTGLLLVVRILLLTSFSLNQSNNPSINLFVIIVFTTSLLIWLYFTGWVYKSFLNNCLEVFFLCNLSLTSTAALFELSDNSQSPTVIYASTGTAFVVFVGIILYHAQRRVLLSRVGAKLKKLV